MLSWWGVHLPEDSGEGGDDLPEMPGEDLPSDSRGEGQPFDP